METLPSLLPAASSILVSIIEEKATQSTDSSWNFSAPSGFSLFSLLRENSLTVLSQHPTAANLGHPTLCQENTNSYSFCAGEYINVSTYCLAGPGHSRAEQLRRSNKKFLTTAYKHLFLALYATHLIATAEAPSEDRSSDADMTSVSSNAMLKDTTLPAAPHATPRSGVISIDKGVISSILT